MDHSNDVDPASPIFWVGLFFGSSVSLMFFSDRDESLRLSLKWANDADCHALLTYQVRVDARCILLDLKGYS